MPAAPNGFIWYDLMTADIPGAMRFYASLFGWSGEESGPADRSYTVLSAGDAKIGGLMAMPPGTPRPNWIGYIGVDDVDAKAAAITEAGGYIYHAPEDIPHVGRFAVAADPDGAPFIVFNPAHVDLGAAFRPMVPGHVGWNELHAADPERAFAFYAGLFGWTKGPAHDMGPMGTYQIFATGGPDAGGIVKTSAAMPHPFWVYYFGVESVGASIAVAREAGGQIVNGPHQVPGGGWIAHGMDPQGALFALVGPE
jgi:predicted enzyme related to lactoylglutathione lyase